MRVHDVWAKQLDPLANLLRLLARPHDTEPTPQRTSHSAGEITAVSYELLNLYSTLAQQERLLRNDRILAATKAVVVVDLEHPQDLTPACDAGRSARAERPQHRSQVIPRLPHQRPILISLFGSRPARPQNEVSQEGHERGQQ